VAACRKAAHHDRHFAATKERAPRMGRRGSTKEERDEKAAVLAAAVETAQAFGGNALFVSVARRRRHCPRSWGRPLIAFSWAGHRGSTQGG